MFAGQMHFPARRMKGKEASPKVLLPVFGQADWDFLAPTGVVIGAVRSVVSWAMLLSQMQQGCFP